MTEMTLAQFLSKTGVRVVVPVGMDMSAFDRVTILTDFNCTSDAEKATDAAWERNTQPKGTP